jgi:hypothetical protein
MKKNIFIWILFFYIIGSKMLPLYLKLYEEKIGVDLVVLYFIVLALFSAIALRSRLYEFGIFEELKYCEQKMKRLFVAEKLYACYVMKAHRKNSS